MCEPAGCGSLPPTDSGMKLRSLGSITGFEPPEPGGGNFCWPATRLPSLLLPEDLPGCCRYPPDIVITSHGRVASMVLQGRWDVDLDVGR